MEHIFIKHTKVGDSFRGTYFLQDANEKIAKNGNPYCDMTLRDRTGASVARLWGPLEVPKGEYVNVVARVEEYNSAPQIVLSSITHAEKPDDMSNYIAISTTKEKDLERLAFLQGKVAEYTKQVGNNLCANVVSHALDGDIERFIVAPYGTLAFYGKQGGLLAHTVRVGFMALELCKPYGLNYKEKLIMTTASLLHAIGSIDSVDVKNLIPTETTEGILLGRSNLSLMRVDRSITSVSGADMVDREQLAMRLRHAMLACSYPSTMKPMTKEAVVLHEAFKSDYNIVEALDFMTTDTNPDEFTAYDGVLKRRYFKG